MSTATATSDATPPAVGDVPAPCPLCAAEGCGREARHGGARFGVAARICKYCCGLLRNRARQARRVAGGAVPCGLCRSRAGYTRPHEELPTRYRMVAGGEKVLACHECRYPPKGREPKPAPAPAAVVACVVPARPSDPDLAPAAIRRAALAIHSQLAAAGDAIEDERIRATERGPGREAEVEAAKRRDAARAAIREGLASERARKVWAPALAAKVATFEPDLDRVPVAAKKKGPGPGLSWRTRKTAGTFLAPTTPASPGRGRGE